MGPWDWVRQALGADSQRNAGMGPAQNSALEANPEMFAANCAFRGESPGSVTNAAAALASASSKVLKKQLSGDAQSPQRVKPRRTRANSRSSLQSTRGSGPSPRAPSTCMRGAHRSIATASFTQKSIKRARSESSLGSDATHIRANQPPGRSDPSQGPSPGSHSLPHQQPCSFETSKSSKWYAHWFSPPFAADEPVWRSLWRPLMNSHGVIASSKVRSIARSASGVVAEASRQSVS
mmetsp:Transcript_403/g.1251  ORF Transcript_403/g.1251 Transcript_403/m.1251 type:complete len:236 (-) Transcript_403:640-1347(-)